MIDAQFPLSEDLISNIEKNGIKISQEHNLAFLEDKGFWIIADCAKKTGFVFGKKTKKEVLEKMGLPIEEIEAILKIVSEKNSTERKVRTFYKETPIYVKRFFCSVYDLEVKGKSIEKNEHYNIYEFSFGAGALDKICYLFVNPGETKSLGDLELYLRPLENTFEELEYFKDALPENRILSSMCEKQGIPKTNLLKNLVAKHIEEPIFFCETTGVPEEELENLIEEDWQTELSKYINGEIQKDKILEQIYKADLMKPNPQKIKPQQYQPYNHNQLVFINTKVGKSWTAEKTGRRMDRASIGNLLGFSTAQEKNEGSLNGETRTVSIDEIQEEKNEEAHSQLSNYLELGMATTCVGKAQVSVRGYAAIRWQGNKKIRQRTAYGEITEEELFQSFVDALAKISKNHEAFGGRISEIVFRTDIERADTSKVILSPQEVEQNAAIVKTVLEKARNPFTKLYFDITVLDWLNRETTEKYSEALQEIENASELLEIKDFVKGHRESAHRHLRGNALKLACADFALKLIQEEDFDKNSLLVLAEQYLEKLETQNVESLTNLIKASEKEKTLARYAKSCFANLPFHLRTILESAKKLDWEKGEQNKEFLLEELKPLLRETVNTTLSTEEIVSRTTKDITRVNERVVGLGVQFTRSGGVFKLQLLDREKFKSIWENRGEESE